MVVPRPTPTQFQILRLPDPASKAGIRQNNRSVSDSFDERRKFLIGNIRHFDRLTSDESGLVGEQAEFTADNPLLRSKTFFADAFAARLMAFKNLMAQFNAARINDTEESRLSQEPFQQFSMRFQTAKESGAFR